MSHDLITANPWEELRAHTQARIALGRVGCSLPTREVLAFGLAHAQARDAVHRPLDLTALSEALRQEGFRTLCASSQAEDRPQYLLRPDLGRKLCPQSASQLADQAPTPELVIVLADGLSSLALQRHALPLLNAFKQRFATDWASTPIVLAEQARVALGDEIGQALGAKLVIVMIGERPGLSSPDSLGLYITFAPTVGCPDSARNCISNVRPQGLAYAQAAYKLEHLTRQALRLQLTGVALKDDSELSPLTALTP